MTSIIQHQAETFNEDEDLDNLKLSDLFDRGWRLTRELTKSSADETSVEFLRKRKKSVEILKKCEFMLDELNLFSENEDLDEVSTSEIRL
jgi:immunoglobulin-binding protein 1